MAIINGQEEVNSTRDMLHASQVKLTKERNKSVTALFMKESVSGDTADILDKQIELELIPHNDRCQREEQASHPLRKERIMGEE